MWKEDVFAIILIIVTIYFANQYLIREGFDVNSLWVPDGYCTFMSSRDTRLFLLNDPDGYTSSMSNWDLFARNVTLELNYRKVAGSSAASFDVKKRALVLAAAKRADAYILQLVNKPVAKKYGFDDYKEVEKLVNMQWTFALTTGNVYEDGLPHTRLNVIFLSSLVDYTPDSLFRTLVHEKIHLYQRMYPEHMVQLLGKLGYVRWKNAQGVPRIRANPDTDPYIYVDPATKAPMLAEYASDTPSSVSDITIKHGAQEHPYETMAYDIASMVPISSSTSSN